MSEYRNNFNLVHWKGALEACQDEIHVLEASLGMELGKSRMSSRVRQFNALLNQTKQEEQRIRELEAENVRLNKRYDILAMHMAEVKAIADGCHENTLSDVVEHCLEALKEPPR